MSHLIAPSIYLTIWSALSAVIVFAGIPTLLFFLFKKSKNRAKGILSIAAIALVSQSCSLQKDEQVSPVADLQSQYNAKVVSSEDINPNGLHFNSVEEAKSFLSQFKGFQLNPTDSKQKQLLLAYAKGLPNELAKSLKSTATSSRPPLFWDDPDTGDGDNGDPGTGMFSQTFCPWNSIQTVATWSNGALTNINTHLTGITIGLNWSQQSWQQTGYSAGTYSFTFTYSIDITMFVQGLGTLVAGQSQIGYGTYNPSTGQGSLTSTP